MNRFYASTMGSSHSYVTDPNAFATQVNEDDDRSRWKSYDYVVVGGGALYDRLDSGMTVNRSRISSKARLARYLHLASQRIQICLSS